MKKFQRFLSIVLAFTLCTTLCATAYATDAGADVPAERIRAEKLFDNIEPVSVVTTVEAGRRVTVTTYILEDGNVVIDTFDRGVDFARSYSGSDTVERTVNYTRYGSITLKASFKWWTSSGTPGAIGSWQSVQCTSASGSYDLTNDEAAIEDWAVTKSEGAIAAGTAWAKAYGYFYLATAPVIGNGGSIKIVCDDMGSISDS